MLQPKRHTRCFCQNLRRAARCCWARYCRAGRLRKQLRLLQHPACSSAAHSLLTRSTAQQSVSAGQSSARVEHTESSTHLQTHAIWWAVVGSNEICRAAGRVHREADLQAHPAAAEAAAPFPLAAAAAALPAAAAAADAPVMNGKQQG